MLSPHIYLCCSFYAECVDGTGILEYDVVGDKFIALHTNISGTVTIAPANDRIFVVETGSSIVNIITPGGTHLQCICLLLISPQ